VKHSLLSVGTVLVLCALQTAVNPSYFFSNRVVVSVVRCEVHNEVNPAYLGLGSAIYIVGESVDESRLTRDEIFAAMPKFARDAKGQIICPKNNIFSLYVDRRFPTRGFHERTSMAPFSGLPFLLAFGVVVALMFRQTSPKKGAR
jgi:hypothetical protein